MVAEHASDAAEVVVGIETDRGCGWVRWSRRGYVVYAINPRRCPVTGTVTAWAELNQTAVMPRC